MWNCNGATHTYRDYMVNFRNKLADVARPFPTNFYADFIGSLQPSLNLSGTPYGNTDYGIDFLCD